MSKPKKASSKKPVDQPSHEQDTRRNFLGKSGLVAGGLIALNSRSGNAQATPGHATAAQDHAAATAQPGEDQSTRTLTPCSTVRTRKNIMAMTAAELQAFREAIAALKARPAANPTSFAAYAQHHATFCSGPPALQIHFGWFFLPWHRAYLYRFEQLLQAVRPGVTLPYWSWTTTRTIPPAYTQNPASNTLFHSARLRNPVGGTAPSMPATMATAARITALMGMNWTLFGGGPIPNAGGLEVNPHNPVHGWVGGDMGVFATAARDPLFYAHHCNVDRVWARWQRTHPNPADPTWLNRRLDPFNVTIQETLRVESLCYRYVDFTLLLAMDRNRDAAGPGYHSETIKLEDDQLDALRNREAPEDVQLHVEGVEIPKKVSQEFRVFLNVPNANRDTQTEGIENFVDSFTLVPLGHEQMDHEKKDGGNEQLTKVNIALPVPASATRSALRDRADLSATIVQVPLDEGGGRAAEERLKIDSVRLEVVR